MMTTGLTKQTEEIFAELERRGLIVDSGRKRYSERTDRASESSTESCNACATPLLSTQTVRPCRWG